MYAAAAVVVIGLLVGWESFWQSRGFEPSVNDDALLWAVARYRVARTPASVVIVGGSRSLVGIDPDVIERNRNVVAVQLAIDGNSGIPILEHLAADPSFRGIVIFDLMEEHIRGLVHPRQQRTHGVTEQYIDAYEHLSRSQAIEREVRSQWQLLLASRSPSLSVRNVASAVIRGQYPTPPPMVMAPNRSTHIHYNTRNDSARLREVREQIAREEYGRIAPLTVEEFLQGADRLEEMVYRIQTRGGRVVIVRMPTTGTLWNLDEARYPKTRYWDALAKRTTARTIHFRDHPALAGYNCPDGSHLDASDATGFTEALVKIAMMNPVGDSI